MWRIRYFCRMRLNSRHFGEGKPVLILHGLFGSSDNWLSFGKALALHGYNVHLLDLRNHGQSPHDHTFDYASLSSDVAEYIESSGIVNPVVAGHSLGGKTTIKLATTAPHLLSAMVIIDIAPRFYPVHHKQIIDALESVDFTLMKRVPMWKPFFRSQSLSQLFCNLCSRMYGGRKKTGWPGVLIWKQSVETSIMWVKRFTRTDFFICLHYLSEGKSLVILQMPTNRIFLKDFQVPKLKPLPAQATGSMPIIPNG